MPSCRKRWEGYEKIAKAIFGQGRAGGKPDQNPIRSGNCYENIPHALIRA